MRIAICDDDINITSEIRKIFNQYIKENNINNIEFSYFNSSVILERATNNGVYFDAYFLDVLMDGKNGIRIASLIRTKRQSVPIVFLTSSKDYAIAAFGVRANNYLMKPIEKDKLIEELKLIVDDFSNAINPSKEKEMFSIPMLRSSVDINIYEVMYIKTVAHIFYFYMDNNKVIESSTLRISSSDFLNPISAKENFIQIRRGTIINLNYVDCVNAQEFVMKNKETFKPPRDAFVELRKKYFDYLANN